MYDLKFFSAISLIDCWDLNETIEMRKSFKIDFERETISNQNIFFFDIAVDVVDSIDVIENKINEVINAIEVEVAYFVLINMNFS